MAGRVNRNVKLGNDGQGLVNLFLPEEWRSNRNVASLPYDPELLGSSISLVREEARSIVSELDYLDLTNRYYDQFWSRSEESEERFEEIWNQVHYIYRAKLSEEGMIELLRTRSGIMTINAYSGSHWDEIMNLDRQLNLATTEQRYGLQQRIRMYSINLQVVRSAVFIHKNGYADLTDYIVVEADY